MTVAIGIGNDSSNDDDTSYGDDCNGSGDGGGNNNSHNANDSDDHLIYRTIAYTLFVYSLSEILLTITSTDTIGQRSS